MSKVNKPKSRRYETREEFERRMRVRKIREEKLMKNKTNLFRFIVVSMIFFLIGRISYIQLVHGYEYEQASVVQPTTKNTEQVLTASRGDMIDRNGKLLASSSSFYRVYIDIYIINQEDEKLEDTNKDKNKKEVAKALEEILEVDGNEVLSYFTREDLLNSKYHVIKDNVAYSVAKELRNYKTEDGNNLIGVHLEETNIRMYTYKSLASQTIGFISGDGGSNNWGLENYYDTELTGIPGRYFTSYDGSRNVINNEIEPIKGNTLALTLDYELQQYTDELAAKYGIQHGAENASIIVMGVDSGEILAMSEYPTFDNNKPGETGFFNDPTFQERFDLLAEDDPERGDMIYKVWKNFNISNTFEPGSIYKPLVVAAAIDENIIAPHDTFQCDGFLEYDVDDKILPIKCWIYNDSGTGHGIQNVEEVLSNSCNVGMMKIGEKMGRKVFSKYQVDFGFGTKTGIDLVGEEGIDVIYKEENINIIELVTGSFGQGFNATALQNLVAFNASINGGILYKPYVVSQIIDEKGKVIKHNEPEVVKKVISKTTSDYIRRSLLSVVTEGTGKSLAIEGYSIGGKTATGEQGVRGDGEYTVSFIGYIPVENPQYIAIGVIDKPSDYETNRTSAVPMMREVFLKLINYYKIPNDLEISTLSDKNNVELVSDYTGKEVISIARELNNKNYNYILVGSGDIIKSQMPSPNSVITDSTSIFLYLEESDNAPNLVEIPDIVGLNEEQSIELLEAANLSYTVIKELSEEENTENEENYVVREQIPTTGAKVPAGTEIKVYYHQG